MPPRHDGTRLADPLPAIGRFVAGLSLGAIPPAVLLAARNGVVDYLGVAAAGAADPAARTFAQYLATAYGPGSATALGLDGGLTAEGAAWVNGVAGHVLDFDDCSDAMMGHPSVAVLPAVFALCEQMDIRADEALAAYVIGVEVACMIGRCVNPVHYDRGWHATATLGVLGAAAAAARLLRLDEDETIRCLSIAASFASGIKGNFGTIMKAGQTGFAANKGVSAARLAHAGLGGNPSVFAEGHSFASAFNADRELDWAPVAALGQQWNMLAPGLLFKLYPCCAATHAPIDAAFAMRRAAPLDAKEIAGIRLQVHPRRIPHTDCPRPKTGLQAKFSLQYAVCVALLRGAVTLDDFETRALDDAEVEDLLGKTAIGPLDERDRLLAPGHLDCYAARLEVTDSVGRTRSEFVLAPKGWHPDLAATPDDVRDKFLATACRTAGRSAAAALHDEILEWCAGARATGDLLGALNGVVRGRADSVPDSLTGA